VIQFLTSNSTVRLIEQIVVDAEDDLVLVSPSPRFSRKLAGQLQDACQRGVSIDLMVDDVLFDDAMILSLTDLDQFRVLRCRDLNAQCYMNESTMVVTTMTISDLPSTGIHVGLSASSDEPAFLDARCYVDDLKSADDVKVTEVLREVERVDVKKPRASRSPLMRVVRGGIRKRWSASRTRGAKSPVCEICNESFPMQDDESNLCPDCARRKRYQHTSLYLASDSA
jgi:hypothetical protein